MGLLVSAELGSVGQKLGLTVWGQQFVGWRFSLSHAARITKLGGHVAADFPGTTGLFAALIKLLSATALPSFAPRAIDSSSDTVAHLLFLPTVVSSDILVSLVDAVTLQPGSYGLVFGGADSASPTSPYYPFGATGTGVMPQTNADLPGSSYFIGDEFRWNNLVQQTGSANIRFVVEADPVKAGHHVPPHAPQGLKVS